MLYIVMTTPICNLSCRYCGGSLHGMPEKITYSFDELQRFISDDNEAVVAFYGGEPLLNSEVIHDFVTKLNASHFVINTNGSFIKDSMALFIGSTVSFCLLMVKEKSLIITVDLDVMIR